MRNLGSVPIGLAVLGLALGLCSGQGTLTSVYYDAGGNLILVGGASAGSPAIVAGPVGRLAQVGQAAAFSVNVMGSAPLVFRWFFNNSAMPTATNDSLAIPSVGPADFGSYYVVVANSVGSVTSVVVQLQLDSDGDGLADNWEIANFGSITNQNAVMDGDGDGNSNLTEFRDATNPTNKSSLLPRLSIRAIGGDVLLTPDNDHYDVGDLVTLAAAPYDGLSFLCWAGDLSGTNLSTNLVMNADKFVQATFGLPLSLVLDNTNAFTTGGDGGWFGQTNDSHDGISAARSAPIIKHPGSGSASWLQTTVTLAKDGTVSFWWRSDTADNYVEFVVDNNRIFTTTRTINNVTPWQFHTSYLPAGKHILNWTFHHAADGSSLDTGYAVVPQDSAFLDQVVITEYADPNLDSDGDGLPDLWEYRYFDTLSYGTSDDPDSDGVNNATEFADGTNPASGSSVYPRLTYIVEGEGTTAASPSLTKYAYGQTVTNLAAPGAGWQFVAWRGPFLTQTSVTSKTNNPSTVQLYTSQTVRAIFGLPLGEATDAPSLTWTNGGELGWYGQTNITLDGASAARSAPISSSAESWMETSVQGPGTLSFWWKVDSTTNMDQLTFRLNGVTQPGGISGVIDWQEQTYYLGAGPLVLRWRFKRNGGSDTNRLAAAWVDQVQLSTGNTAPIFVLQPTNQTVLQISNVIMQVFARGTPPISYQLFQGASPYGSPTNNPVLVISNPAPSLAGAWTVHAVNPGGMVASAPFTLGVIPAPPSNDNFSGRLNLTSTNFGYNFGATTENGEPYQTGSGSVWWQWTAPKSGTFRVIAQATNATDTLALGVYSGTSVIALTALGTTSFSTTNDPDGDQIQAASDTFVATPSATYAIGVGSSLASGAWFGLWVEYLPPPPNDLFANRTPLIGASAFDSSQLRTATAEPGEPAHDGLPAANSVWWSWIAPHRAAVTVNVSSPTIIPRAAVYTGSSLASLKPVVAGFGGSTNLNTVLSFNATAGTAYQIAVDSFFGSVGDVQINIALNNPSFTAPVINSQNNLTVSIQGPAGASFVVESSDDLQTWGAVYSGVIPASGIFDFQAAIPPGAKSRFYRVRFV